MGIIGIERLPSSQSSLSSSLEGNSFFSSLPPHYCCCREKSPWGIFSTSSFLRPKPGFPISNPSKVNGSFSESILKMGFGMVKVSPYMVIMALSCEKQTFQYKNKGMASVSWIHGNPRSILKHEAMFRT